MNKNIEFPYIESKTFYTKSGTPYLKSPGVALASKPSVNLVAAKSFLAGFPKDYNFEDYIKDPVSLPSAEILTKFAGQTCYMSFGKGRTWNKDAQKYFDNIITSGHGSVLEHANYTFLLWGVSRSFTHELVRHRAGVGYSQVSQRYVSGRVLRFVERPEYQKDKTLHKLFEERIDRAYKDYSDMANYLYGKQEKGYRILSGEQKTDLRKKVQQVARSVLPNETEAPIVVTANIRAWRHMVNMRASDHAEIEIRNVFFNIFKLLKILAPKLFKDFRVIKLPDGTNCVKTDYPKV
jgi:thymidylate synthase (FAD)